MNLERMSLYDWITRRVSRLLSARQVAPAQRSKSKSNEHETEQQIALRQRRRGPQPHRRIEATQRYTHERERSGTLVRKAASLVVQRGQNLEPRALAAASNRSAGPQTAPDERRHRDRQIRQRAARRFLVQTCECP